MAYGKIKADTLVYDNSGTDTDVTIASLGAKADLNSPTFTGTPTVPGYAALSGATFTGDVIMSADLTVQGTTTTISSTTIEVADKNLELGKVSTPTDTTADGGGITLKGATDKTFNWVDATDSWTSNQKLETTDVLKVKSTSSEANVQLQNDARTWKIVNYDYGTGADNLGFHDGSGDRLIINHTTGNATFGGTVSDSLGDLRSIPIETATSAQTPNASSAGHAIYISTGGVTINNSVFSTGDAVTIINNSGSDQTITQGSGLTLYNTADASTGNRTLAGRGMATIWFASASVGYISGAGLS